MALTSYQTQVQRLLHDANATYYSLSDITAYINTARGQISLEGQCVRALISGYVSSVAVNAVGSGYTSPTVVFSGSGTGATATATLSGGTITNVTVVSTGSGYDATTTATISDPTGTGCTLTVTMAGTNLTVVGQEVYTFASRAPQAQLVSGVQGILGVISVAVSWGSMKPLLRQEIWTRFQAYYRSYSTGLQSWPTIWSQYAQGVNGSMYVWPLPSQVVSMDWDCFCRPLDLVDGNTPEAIPYPWTDAVQYYAAMLAFDNSQRATDADRMQTQYTKYMKRARAMSEPELPPDPYYADEY